MFHRCKYGKVEEGYQYCLKCGKAILAPVVKCQHVWVISEKYDIYTHLSSDRPGHHLISDRCSKCGEIKITKVSPDLLTK